VKHAPTPEDFAHARLLAYAKYHWNQFEISRYHAMIANHLQLIEKGEEDRLIISLPPRSGKTMMITYFIAWFLGRNPTSEVIYTSYNTQRASDVGRNCRNLMASEIHSKIFPNGRISIDAKATSKFSTEAGGTFFATGWGSSVTGRGANIFIVDDLIRDRVDDRSELNSKNRIEWFSSTAYTRLMPKDLDQGRISAIIAIGTRWSYRDFISYLKKDLKHEKWIDLSFPAICEDVDIDEDLGTDLLGRQSGEALWPEKFPVETLKRTKKTMSSLDWSALYQQRPLPTAGGMIHLEWFQRFDLSKMYELRDAMQQSDDIPATLKFIHKITISVDSASKTHKISDKTAITVWGSNKENTNHYLLDCIDRRVEFPELIKLVKTVWNTYKKWELGVPEVICEDRSSGIALIQHLKRNSQIPIIPITPCKSKELRMEDALAHIEAGRIWLPNQASWLYGLEEQLAQFPLGKYRDICDSLSQFINRKYGKIVRRKKYKGYIR